MFMHTIINLSSYIVLLIISFFLFSIIVILGVRFEVKSEIMNKEITDYLRGVFAIIIVLGHFINHLSNPALLRIYDPVTGYCVSAFLDFQVIH